MVRPLFHVGREPGCVGGQGSAGEGSGRGASGRGNHCTYLHRFNKRNKNLLQPIRVTAIEKCFILFASHDYFNFGEFSLVMVTSRVGGVSPPFKAFIELTS